MLSTQKYLNFTASRLCCQLGAIFLALSLLAQAHLAQAEVEDALPEIYSILFSEDTTEKDCEDSEYPVSCSFTINNESRSTKILTTDGGTIGVLEDVQVAEIQTVDGVDYIYIETSNIPNYDVLITSEIVEALNNRLRAVSGFVTGSTIISTGDTVVFGHQVQSVHKIQLRLNFLPQTLNPARKNVQTG